MNQTLVRSINTSVVGLLPVASTPSWRLPRRHAPGHRVGPFIGMLRLDPSSIFIATPRPRWP